ncbi:hypothetical protein PRK78_007028 [Emydomyces testavorans]|uniref:DUF7924 domain-containing protein n=1 Tax=Emydomyces testavorans TaxID=2070801 RepID=A0AAF0DNM5_9EURO|nr:hypothetical protein PRK78_007028 [Emydomyces testavorans]
MPLSLKRHQELVEPEPKRQKVRHPVCEGAQRPPEFWDNLSKIWLTTKALRELDRRNTLSHAGPYVTKPHRPITRQFFAEHQRKNCVQDAPNFLSRCTLDFLKQIKAFARHGGPDLSDLGNFHRRPLNFDMAKRRLPDTNTSNAKSRRTSQSTGSYSLGFEQHLIDHGVYPDGYEYPDGTVPELPKNWDDIDGMLSHPRASLSPSKFGVKEFQQFKRANAYATSEKKLTKIIETLEGGSDDKTVGGDYPFGNFEPLTDDTIPNAKPDHFHGSRPEELNRQIREELNGTIIPSAATSRPMLPNFFLEIKTPDQSSAVAKRQACYDGALGARAMQSLQSYGGDSIHDNNAYTIASIYQDGTLKLYTSHPTKSSAPERRTEYFMTQINTWGMTGNIESFRQGATAYRNARDWAKGKRSQFIEAANRRLAETDTSQSVTATTSAAALNNSEASAANASLLETESQSDSAPRDAITSTQTVVDSITSADSDEYQDAELSFVKEGRPLSTA